MLIYILWLVCWGISETINCIWFSIFPYTQPTLCTWMYFFPKTLTTEPAQNSNFWKLPWVVALPRFHCIYLTFGKQGHPKEVPSVKRAGELAVLVIMSSITLYFGEVIDLSIVISDFIPKIPKEHGTHDSFLWNHTSSIFLKKKQCLW